MTPGKPTVKKTAPATKKAAAPEPGKNMTKLIQGKVITKDYSQFSPAEKKAIESLSSSEVSAIISTHSKLGKGNFTKLAAHGMYF